MSDLDSIPTYSWLILYIFTLLVFFYCAICFAFSIVHEISTGYLHYFCILCYVDNNSIVFWFCFVFVFLGGGGLLFEFDHLVAFNTYTGKISVVMKIETDTIASITASDNLCRDLQKYR